MGYSIVVVAYDQKKGTFEPAKRHWSILLKPDNGDLTSCHKYDIQGAPGNFTYKSNESYNLLVSTRKRIEVVIGHLHDANLPLFKQVMEATPIKHNDPEDPGWNCQGWVMDALENARQHGFQFNEDYAAYPSKMYE